MYIFSNKIFHVFRHFKYISFWLLSFLFRGAVVNWKGSLSDGKAKENVTLKMTSKYFNLVRNSFNLFILSFRLTCQLQDVCLYSETMAALKPYCFEPERANNSEDDESGDD